MILLPLASRDRTAETTACVALAQATKSVGRSVEALLTEMGTVHMGQQHHFSLAGITRDDWAETKEALATLVENYAGGD